MATTEKKQIAFKEKDKNNQFYRDEDGNWVKCDEATIDSLWNIWVESKNANKYKDEDGFNVYDYETNEQPINYGRFDSK